MKDKKNILKLPNSKVLPDLDLDIELFRQNVLIAQIMILSGLIHGDQSQREKIFTSMRKDYFSPKLFEGYLFEAIANHLKDSLVAEISPDFLVEQIPKYYSVVWGSSPENSKGSLRSLLFTCAQMLHMHPSEEQIDKAIELRKLWAQKRNNVLT